MSKKNRTSKGPASPNRMMLRRTLVLMIVCGIVAFIVLGARLFKIQIIDHEKYESAAVEQQLREVSVPAKRGTIYDRNMNILAISASSNNIIVSPAEIDISAEEYDKEMEENSKKESDETEKPRESRELIAQGLSEILGISYDEIMDKIGDSTSYYVKIASKVDDETTELVRQFKEENDFLGIKIEESTKRFYPYSSLACHVIGFVGSDDYGLSGIEYYYDDILSGTDGRIVRATNAYGTDMLFTDFEDYYDAEDGNSLVLTLDETVQYYLEKHLEEAVEDYMLQDGAAGIVMDVNTGAILGMASLDNFDLNDYLTVGEEAQARVDAATDDDTKNAIMAEERSAMWRNKALSDTYEPGSVFKIITLAMGLESGAIDMNTSFYCGGNVTVSGRVDPLNCWQTSGHGAEDLTHAVMNSCNVAFVNIGQRIGAERFYEYAKAFGLFEETGIDLQGESNSIWWSEDVFYDESNLSQLAAASFGQTFTVTPLQMITAVSAVANGGYLMKPYIVSEVLDEDGNIVDQTEPTVVRQVVSEQTSELCCQILEQVVGDPEGTGKNAYVAGYSVCGKTGTSEDIVYQAETGTKKYIVSFLGFAPADDPQVAVLVLLKNPSSDCGVYISGGQMAAPVVGSILGDILPVLGVEPEYSEEEQAYVDKTVPRLIGKTVAEAQAAVTEAGLTCRVEGNGATVTAQIPVNGSVVATDSEIVLYCGEEPATGTTEMLDLTGLDYETARIRMGWSGLYINEEGALLGSSGSYITRQSVEAGTEIAEGSVVTVSLSDSSNLGRY